METLSQSFGRRLRAIRDERGLSRQKLGELIGLSSTSIAAIEGGSQWPSAENIERICAFFKVPVAALFTDEAVKIQPTIEESLAQISAFIEEVRARPATIERNAPPVSPKDPLAETLEQVTDAERRVLLRMAEDLLRKRGVRKKETAT